MTTHLSPVGELTLASDGTSLTGLWLAGQKYFGSTLRPNAPPLAPQGSPFRQAVWTLLSEIPYGGTTTYGTLAKQLQKLGIPAAAQAVGGAVGHNPILILIPCHRVLGSNGSLTGYAAGTDVKQRLLQLEGYQL